MGALTRLGLFVGALGVVFGASYTLGAVTDADGGDDDQVPTTTVLDHTGHDEAPAVTTP